MADYARLGHYLPYLLGRRLQAVVWPERGGERVLPLLLLGLMLLYGLGFGVLLRHRHDEEFADLLPHLLPGLNAAWLVSALLVDFLPALRPVTRPLPEHFPVSERANVLTAFLLDFITLRRLLLATLLLAALATASWSAAAVPGFSLLLVLAATVWSFNVRFLVTLQRWRHPLLLAHLASLGLMGWWLLHPQAPCAAVLGWGMALLPGALWAAQYYWLGPRFSTRYLPAGAAPAALANPALARLPLLWRAYLRRVWLPLAISLVFKVLLLVITGLFLVEDGQLANQGFFYLALLPTISFTYVNNNLFAFMGPVTANELQRLGLTRRLAGLYLRLAGPVVAADCLVAAVLLLFPPGFRSLLGLLPLGGLALLSLGFWGSLYKAKPVVKPVDFANMRHNTSQLMSFLSIGTAALLYFLPWWWARVPLALLVTASAIIPLRQVGRNDGELRRRLWAVVG